MHSGRSNRVRCRFRPNCRLVYGRCRRGLQGLMRYETDRWSRGGLFLSDVRTRPEEIHQGRSRGERIVLNVSVCQLPQLSGCRC